MKLSRLFLVGLFLVDACVDRIFIDIPAVPLTDLVVDAQITDEQGPYTVKLTAPIQPDQYSILGQPVSVKKVTISDNLGNSEVLTQTSTGVYQTSANGIRGIVGRSYTLRIDTNDGKVVVSESDLLNQVGEMDSLYYEFVSSQPKNSPTEYGYNIYVDGGGIPDNDNFIRWKFTGTYVVETKPQYYTEATGNCPPCGCPLPPACSGWAIVPGLGLREGYGIVPPSRTPTYIIGLTCTCCRCWVTDHERRPIVSSNQFVSGGKFPHVEVAYVPVNYYTFYQKYKIAVDQMSLSKTAFEYYRAIDAQRDGTGSLFQPVTGKIPTNLSEATHTLTVHGIFYASSIKRKQIILDKNTHHVDIPDPVNCDGRVGAAGQSCLNAFPGSTTKKPAGWD